MEDAVCQSSISFARYPLHDRILSRRMRPRPARRVRRALPEDGVRPTRHVQEDLLGAPERTVEIKLNPPQKQYSAHEKQ